MPLAADDAVAVGPDQKVEGDLQGAGIEDVFASQDHVDQRQGEVSHVAVDQVASVHRVQPQRPLQQSQRRDPEEIGHDPQDQRAEESTQAFRCQVDLDRTADQAGLENVDRQTREREAVLALHHMEFDGRIADHHHDHHRHQFAHQDQSHTHLLFLRFLRREIIHQAGFYNCLTSEPLLFKNVTVIRLSVCFIPAECKNSHLSTAVYVLVKKCRDTKPHMGWSDSRETVPYAARPLDTLILLLITLHAPMNRANQDRYQYKRQHRSYRQCPTPTCHS